MGFNLKKIKKVKQKVNLRFSDKYDDSEVYLPIMDKKIKSELKQFKLVILDTIEKAKIDDKDVIVEFKGATFKIYPNADKSIVSKFKTNEW